METPCPLCQSARTVPFVRVHGRDYRDCVVCGLIHMAPAHRPSREAERAHYSTHENEPSDTGYRTFLRRVADPLVARLSPGARGLDYGSGPGPTLSLMMEEHGFSMAIYDPFFAPDRAVLAGRYDFITCTETAEHFFHPGGELERLDGLLRPGGWLAMMTEVYDDGKRFGEWRYARDPTHVSLYRRRTLEWAAERFGWSLEMPHRNVALFRKAGPTTTG
jgi:Zn ribbon nucleic-acid-binding protein